MDCYQIITSIFAGFQVVFAGLVVCFIKQQTKISKDQLHISKATSSYNEKLQTLMASLKLDDEFKQRREAIMTKLFDLEHQKVTSDEFRELSTKFVNQLSELDEQYKQSTEIFEKIISASSH